MEELISWFAENLPAPDRFNESTSKGAWRRNAAGISWFKPTATEHIANMRELVALLQDAGVHSEEVSTYRPGYVVYEDPFQIVAEPFRETRRYPIRTRGTPRFSISSVIPQTSASIRSGECPSLRPFAPKLHISSSSSLRPAMWRTRPCA